mmetsp:Transcript_10690/g.20067  ORF Transcript_10690/g.20067 Transcript_10690/m.20067 type:complete len:351 (-) Transcript_10690:207-1259(-)
MQRAHDHVADDVGTLAHGRANVRAQVADAEQGAGLRLANQDVVAGQGQGLQLLRLQLRRLHARADPRQGRQDGLGGVARRGLGCCLRPTAGGSAEGRSLAGSRFTRQGRHAWNAARHVVTNNARKECHHGKSSILELLELHALHAFGILGQLQGVETEISGLTVHLANPRVLGEVVAFNDQGKGRDLSNAQTHNTCRIVIASLQRFVPRRFRVARDVQRSLRKDAHNCEHGTPAVFQLGLPQPLHMRKCHVAVELEVSIVEFAPSHRIPWLADLQTHLDIRSNHGQTLFVAAGHRGGPVANQLRHHRVLVLALHVTGVLLVQIFWLHVLGECSHFLCCLPGNALASSSDC